MTADVTDTVTVQAVALQIATLYYLVAGHRRFGDTAVSLVTVAAHCHNHQSKMSVIFLAGSVLLHYGNTRGPHYWWQRGAN
jgi:hypothetical protein